jgi:3-hydroxyacyl-[acyl-carrier-protein] dehydratase
MLFGNFYDLQSFTTPETDVPPLQFTAVVRLNPGHPIYQGHFPGNPVVPGVCQVQMARELVERSVNRPLRLTASDNIKFLSMINPVQNPELEFSILVKPVSARHVSATVSIVAGSSVFLKFKGEFEYEK